jgi:acetolactate synthase-1/3 small subunit
MEQYSIIIRYINNPGFLIRVALLLERRGYTIQSLEITQGKEEALMELIMQGLPFKYVQVVKQIQKLVDVISVEDCSEPIKLESSKEKMIV